MLLALRLAPRPWPAKATPRGDTEKPATHGAAAADRRACFARTRNVAWKASSASW